MNVQITWEGTDITTSVIEYSREQDICTGFGTLDLNVEAKTAKNFKPWDTIILYEDGHQVHIYNIASEEQRIPDGMYVVNCQDDSKRLTDFFIDTLYTIDYPSSCRYWIELFLNQSGVTYNFNVDDYGTDLSDNTSLGGTSAYDAIIQLLQMSGWYLYFDSDNICQIGNLDVSSIPVASFTTDEILEIGYTKSDKMLRNRVVVWGASDKDSNWIFADTSTMTPWNRDAGDYRTTVYANGLIKTFGIAYSLAKTILDEFSKTIPQKNLQVVGAHSEVVLGSVISGNTRTLSVQGMVTHIIVNLSSDGFTSTYTLDKVCPRLFGYASWNDWVYIGTQGKGVWRKWLKNFTWYDYSTGITDLNIKDLSAYDGLLGSVTDGGKAYIRHTSEGSWRQYAPAGLTNNFVPSGALGSGIFGSIYVTSGILAEASSLDRLEGVAGAVTIGFSVPNPSGLPLPSGTGDLFPASGNLSWIQSVALGGYPVYTQQIVVISGGETNADFGIVDLETNWDGNNLISVFNGKTKPGLVVPICSGAKFDYKGPTVALGGLTITAGGQLTFGPSYEGAGHSITVMPAPTSGIVVEQTSWDLNEMPFSGGFWLTSVFTGNIGGIITDDDYDYDGKIYNFGPNGTYGTVTKNYVCVASGTWDEYGGYDYTATINYNFAGDFITDYTAYTFHKIDENNFAVCKFTFDYINYFGYFDIYQINTPETPIPVWGQTQTASGTITGHTAITIERLNYLQDDYTFLAGPQILGGSRYTGILYAQAPVGAGNPPPEVKFSVIDSFTGSINTITICGTEYGYYRAISLYGVSPNYGYFGVVEFLPIQQGPPDSWDGFKVHKILFNRNTGSISHSYTSLRPQLPLGPITLEVGSWDLGGYPTDYRYFTVGPANENPDTGIGFGHFFCHVGIGWKDYPFIPQVSNDAGEVLVVDWELSTIGEGSVRTWQDTYFGEVGGFGKIINSPDWTRSREVGIKDTLKVYPTFSRYVSNTPVCIMNYTGTSIDTIHAFIDPHDFDTVVGYPEIPPDYVFFELLYPMMDDVDDTIYGSVSKIWGSDSITVGYDISGNLTKILFPQLDGFAQDFTTGQPLENKLFRSFTDSNYEIITIPVARVLISDRIRGTGRYNILFHDPKATASGLFTIIYEDSLPLYLDTSKNIPTIFYHKPYADDFPSSTMGRSFLNELGSFEVISPGGGMGTHDVRVFDLTDPLGFLPASGITASGFLDRFAGVAGGHLGLVMYNSSFDREGGAFVPYMQIASGNITHVDFTNNNPNPYMFVCASGTSNASGRFMQYNPNESMWFDCSATLPSGMITIIRADDRM